MAEWYEEIFDNDYIKVYRETEKETSNDVDGIIDLLEPTKDQKIIDLCCGYGRHSIELAKRGYTITGYDLSKDFLKHAEQTAHSEGVLVNFIEGDIRDLDYIEEFDIAINLFTSFGYFDDEENQDVLNLIARSLVPNGRFLIQSLNYSGIIRGLNETEPGRVRETEGLTIIDFRTVDHEKDILNVKRRIFFEDGKRKEYSFSVRLYTLADMLKMLDNAGLTLVDYYSNLKGSAYDINSNQYVILAEKTP